MQSAKFVRKPFYVDAVRVTADNLEEVAEWAGGNVEHTEVRGSKGGDPYIKVRVHNPMSERQTKAFVGDWVLYANKGYKVYTDKAFKAAFDPTEKADDSPELVLDGGELVEA